MTADIQDAVGEDMTAIEVARQLHFVDSDEIRLQVQRHGLNRRDPEPRVLRDDLFFAGDQRHRFRTRAVGNTVIDFTREQAQRQPYQP